MLAVAVDVPVGEVGLQVFGVRDDFTIFVVDIMNEYIFTCSSSKNTSYCWHIHLE